MSAVGMRKGPWVAREEYESSQRWGHFSHAQSKPMSEHHVLDQGGGMALWLGRLLAIHWLTAIIFNWVLTLGKESVCGSPIREHRAGSRFTASSARSSLP